MKSKASEKSKCRVGADEIRPAPPVLVRQHFVADEIVDANDKDGWWIGTIEKALPDNNYLVDFTHSREKVEYHVSQLRLHLDWGDGIWLQPSQLSEHSKGARDGKEEMEKAKEDPSDVNVREEERTDKDESSGREEMGKEKNESLQRETVLSFLHTEKLKADTVLAADSWMYNELMSLKRKMEKVQQNQDMDCAKLSQMDVQLGNILDKLKDCEQNLCLLIKESGNKMEQVTSSFCVAAASSGKRTYEEIMSPGGPSKRTRQSSRKRAAEAIGGSATDSIQGAAEISKEVVKMIKELQ